MPLGEAKGRAESHVNNISAAVMLFFDPNRAKRLGRIPPLECRRVSGVQIPLAPAASQSKTRCLRRPRLLRRRFVKRVTEPQNELHDWKRDGWNNDDKMARLGSSAGCGGRNRQMSALVQYSCECHKYGNPASGGS